MNSSMAPSTRRRWEVHGAVALLVLGFMLALLYMPFELALDPYRESLPGDTPYVLTCEPPDEDGRPVLVLRRAHDGRVLLDGTDGAPPTALVPGTPVTIGIGRHRYALEVVGTWLEWRTVGVHLEPGDRVGRAPLVELTGRMQFPRTCRAVGRIGVPLWADGMPLTALTFRPAACPEGPGACIEVGGRSLDGPRRMTLERADGRRFEPLSPGRTVRVEPSDTLWIAHLPFRLVADETGLVVELIESRSIAGERRRLGRQTYGGRLDLRNEKYRDAIAFHDIGHQFGDGHLEGDRLNPMQADDYQLLVDEGLLCLERTAGDDGQPRFELRWRPLGGPRCGASHDEGSAARPVPALVEDAYARRAGIGGLVARANAIFASDAWRHGPDLLPFVFEWWPAEDADGDVVWLPRAVWGSRMESLRVAAPRRAEGRARTRTVDRAITVGGRPLIISSDTGRRQVTQTLDELGLGPLVGQPGAELGLEAVRGEASAALDVLELTIDPALQARLWSTLTAELDALGVPAERRDRRDHMYGVTAVVLDPRDGRIEAALDWPAGLPDDPRARRYGPRALRRSGAVGSVHKVLVAYALAETGALDEPIANHRRHTRIRQERFGVATVDAEGRVAGCEGVGNLFARRARRVAPLPVGVEGIREGLLSAASFSCNTFFGTAAVLTLDGRVPVVEGDRDVPCLVELLEGQVRVRPDRRSTWRFCAMPEAARGALCGRSKTAPTVWLLPPAGHDAERMLDESLAGLARDGAPGPGWFGRLLAAGYRFDACLSRDCRRRLRGRQQASYGRGPDRVAYRDDWFPAIGSAAIERVYLPPEVRSPRTMLQPGPEVHSEHVHDVVSSDYSPRRVTAAAIGFEMNASALSLAVAYAPLLRDDACFPAPRLLEGAAESPDAMCARAWTPRADGARRAALRTAFAGATGPHGTAHDAWVRLGQCAKVPDGAVVKTGTFAVQHRQRTEADTRAEQDGARACGVLPESEIGVDGADWMNGREAPRLGTPACERRMMTGVHRYPAEPPVVSPRPRRPGRNIVVSHTSAVIGLPGAEPRVLAIVSDLGFDDAEREAPDCGAQSTKALDLAVPLVNALLTTVERPPDPTEGSPE